MKPVTVFPFRSREILLFGDPSSPVWTIEPTARGENEILPQQIALLSAQAPERSHCIAAFPIDSWNDALSPWEADPVFGRARFGSGAEETLREIADGLIPALNTAFSLRTDRRFLLCGYSLAGLFALYAGYRTDTFFGAAAVSPSVWFPDWTTFAAAHPMRSRAVYLSLGRKEEKARDPRLAAVGDAIRAQYRLLTDAGVPCTLEWNEGNHFTDPAGRMARGIAWLEAMCGIF